MFLAIREIRHSKLRYALIAGMIMLIAYLIFVLTALAFGLAQSNRAAIDSWKAENIVLNEDADGSLRQSVLTTDQIKHMKLAGNSAQLGELSAIIKDQDATDIDSDDDGTKTSAEILGIRSDEFIYRQLQVNAGVKFDTDATGSPLQAIADDSLRDDGYRVGDTITVNGGGEDVTIVGFTPHAKLSVAPVLYVPLAAWHDLKFGDNTPPGSPGADVEASAVVLQDGQLTNAVDDVQQFTIGDFINKLPGYSAQNGTFNLMIGFLLVISLVIIAIFLYILTLQKVPNLTVLKVQGVTSGYLIRNTVAQALLISVVGVAVGAGLTALTAAFIPPSVPMDFNLVILGGMAALLIVMAGLGSLAPIGTIIRIRPSALVSGE